MKKTDIGLGLYIMAAIVFLIIRLPSGLLDVFMALNIAIALVVLFNSIFSKEALDMSSFPTLLLFTTIFRISLNVSSTKLILGQGDAGHVVEAFGNFVGGGNIILGAVIFIILILVQMMVINKGSERVAEVTARFTLDAMPGKQMAIDADLNTGAITDKQAQERRAKLQQESAFYGAMDGAVKYVKGDAIAGLIITVINFVGGLLMGVLMGGMELSEAIDKYTLLTIGDGLVSSIPSLAISLATGILVTKNSDSSELGDIVFTQLFGIPKVLWAVGAVLAMLGIITELPIYVFVPLGALCI